MHWRRSARSARNALPFRTEDEKQVINVVLDLWNSRCIGQTNIIYERYLFKNRRRESHESIDVFATGLQCEFGALTDEMIYDRLFCGVIESSKKLLQEPKLSLEKCLDICRSAEEPSAHLKAISGQSTSTERPVDSVNALDKRRKSNSPAKRRSKGSKQPVHEPKEDLWQCCKHSEEVMLCNASNAYVW